MLGKVRQHLQGFLLRHGCVYAGKKGWTLAYRRWLPTVRFDHPAQQIVLQEYIHAVVDAEKRVERLTRQIEKIIPQWSMAPVVEALQAMRGVGLTVAVTMTAEVGDLSRFAHSGRLNAIPPVARAFYIVDMLWWGALGVVLGPSVKVERGASRRLLFPNLELSGSDAMRPSKYDRQEEGCGNKSRLETGFGLVLSGGGAKGRSCKSDC